MFPTVLRLGGFRLATYGVLVASGYLLGISWLSRRREAMGLDEPGFWNIVYVLFFGAILGGKLLYLGVEWRAVLDGRIHPLQDFRYGFVFFGGVLGSCLTGLVWCRREGLSFARIADYIGVALPMGHAVGRWGCLAAGCCYGRPTALPWGIRFSNPESLVDPALFGVPLHPTQLYESAADAAVAALAYQVLKRVEAKRLWPGAAFAVYFGAYSCARFVLESFRGDDRGAGVLGLSPSRALALAVLASVGFVWARRRAA